MSQTADFPLLSSLVIIHYDSLCPNGFVRTQIEERAATYLARGRPIYNLSTLEQPTPQADFIQLPAQDPSPLKGYGLSRQIESLFQLLRTQKEFTSKNFELVGVTWWICVVAAQEELAKREVSACINYDCTDLIQDYIAARRLAPELQINGAPVPKPSQRALTAYRQHRETLEKVS